MTQTQDCEKDSIYTTVQLILPCACKVYDQLCHHLRDLRVWRVAPKVGKQYRSAQDVDQLIAMYNAKVLRLIPIRHKDGGVRVWTLVVEPVQIYGGLCARVIGVLAYAESERIDEQSFIKQL